MDVLAHNRAAWDRNVERRNRWTLPVDAETVDKARGVARLTGAIWDDWVI